MKRYIMFFTSVLLVLLVVFGVGCSNVVKKEDDRISGFFYAKNYGGSGNVYFNLSDSEPYGGNCEIYKETKNFGGFPGSFSVKDGVIYDGSDDVIGLVINKDKILFRKYDIVMEYGFFVDKYEGVVPNGKNFSVTLKEWGSSRTIVFETNGNYKRYNVVGEIFSEGQYVRNDKIITIKPEVGSEETIFVVSGVAYGAYYYEKK